MKPICSLALRLRPTLALALAFALATALLAGSAFGADKKSDTKKPASKNGPGWKKVLPQTPPGFTCTTNLVAAYPEHDAELVIYAPQTPGLFPCVLDIHGGGWTARQVESDKPMMERLAARGFVTALVSYRLAQEAKYPAAIYDCKAALRWLRANATKFKIDPERIGCMGGSAGGHLSGLVGMTSGLPEFDGPGGNEKFSSRVQACIIMAATQDLVAANQGQASTNAVMFFGGSFAERPEIYKQASPIAHVRAGVPPTIFIEGEKDTLKIGRAEMMEKLRALGIETAVHTLKDAPHPFWMSQPWCDETVEIAAAFFKRHLGEPKR
ncbi:MAG: alpha/beta hydrolase [Verrucomicrobia bacterium]|nr:alpha/beta hydrolase [Verrucomicrobiota bacterium]